MAMCFRLIYKYMYIFKAKLELENFYYMVCHMHSSTLLEQTSY